MVTLFPNFLCSLSTSPARGDTVGRAKLDWHAAEWRAANHAHRSDKVIVWDFAGRSLVRRISRKWHLVDVGLRIPPTLLAIADEAIELFCSLLQCASLLVAHKCEVPTELSKVRFQGRRRRHLLTLSSSQFDPERSFGTRLIRSPSRRGRAATRSPYGGRIVLNGRVNEDAVLLRLGLRLVILVDILDRTVSQ
jgi:hypothetical protein